MSLAFQTCGEKLDSVFSGLHVQRIPQFPAKRYGPEAGFLPAELGLHYTPHPFEGNRCLVHDLEHAVGAARQGDGFGDLTLRERKDLFLHDGQGHLVLGGVPHEPAALLGRCAVG